MLVWAAGNTIFEAVNEVKDLYHLPRLQDANVAVSFCDAKAFVKGQLNLGRTSKFTQAHKVWHGDTKYDFLITLVADVWEMLDTSQRQALCDLRLNCCQVSYEPQTVTENGKKKPVKDDFGRVVYSDTVKVDPEGVPLWKTVATNIHAIQDNIARYGCWCEDFAGLRSAIKDSDAREKV